LGEAGNLRTTNKARSHTHKQGQAAQPLHRGPPTPMPTAFQHPKPEGTMRFCVDSRQLNEVKVRDVYPLTCMEDCIDFFGDTNVFLTLVCNLGY